jgi:hypothetical protein
MMRKQDNSGEYLIKRHKIQAAMGPKYVVIKKGNIGALNTAILCGFLELAHIEEAFDPTGADT